MSVITDNAAIDAKAQAELLVVLANAGVKYSDLTQFERFIWQSAYKLAYAAGAKDGVDEARQALRQVIP